MNQVKIGIFFGGSSQEKDISLNSARSVFEVLKNSYDVYLFLLHTDGNFYSIDKELIFSNVIKDFSWSLKSPVDPFKYINFAIPLIHGIPGENGEIQKVFEEKKIPYLFSNSRSCKEMFYKDVFMEKMFQMGFIKWDYIVYNEKNILECEKFLNKHRQVILKPRDGGSSIGVELHKNWTELKKSLKKGSMLEEVHYGKEFSLVVYNGIAQEVLEIIKNGDITTYRDKYFPSEESCFFISDRFSADVLFKIKRKSEEIWRIFQAQTLIRIDGWVLHNGSIIFTEINPIPSFEFNGLLYKSFKSQDIIKLFQDILDSQLKICKLEKKVIENKRFVKEPVAVIMGGDSLEKNVSVISGGSSVIKLMKSNIYEPILFFLKEDKIYEIPMDMTFQHSAKEIEKIIEKFQVESISLDDFIQSLKEENVFAFLALHGGSGEDGTIQQKLEKAGVFFNGENSEKSKVIMNKWNFWQEIPKKMKSQNTFLLQYPYKIDAKILEIIKNGAIIKATEGGSSFDLATIDNKEELEIFLKNKKSEYIIEDYIETDQIEIGNNHLKVIYKTGWLEMTVGYCEQEIFQPTIALKSSKILTSEEKFQSGTGINLKPLQREIISKKQEDIIKNSLKEVLEKLDLKHYGRFDIFFNYKTNTVRIIELNSLPALCYNTIIFFQAYKQNLSPIKFLEKLIFLGKNRYKLKEEEGVPYELREV